MYIYCDKKNEIKAIYSAKPASKVWAKRGYILTVVPDVWRPKIGQKLVVKDKKVVGIK